MSNEKNEYSSISKLEKSCQKIVVETTAKNEAKAIELGICGRFFGEGQNCVFNVTSSILVLCAIAIVVIMVIMICRKVLDPKLAWENLNGIVTLALGYLFGAHTNKNTSEH